MLRAYRRNNKYQFYNLWFDLSTIYHTRSKNVNHYATYGII